MKDKQTSGKYMALCKKCGEKFEPAPFQLDCDECSKTFIQKMMNEADLKERLDAIDNNIKHAAANGDKLILD